MAGPALRGRPTREQAAALEDRLRHAALDAFLEGGFDGTTMEAVAAAAGISKRTLYAKHADKHALFADVVPWALARMSWSDEGEPADLSALDLEAALVTLGRSILLRLVDPRSVRLRRLAVHEAARLPESAKAANLELYREGMTGMRDLLAARSAAGEIAVDDVQVAADQLMALVAASPLMLSDLGVFRTPEGDELHLRQAVRLFLSGVLPR